MSDQSEQPPVGHPPVDPRPYSPADEGSRANARLDAGIQAVIEIMQQPLVLPPSEGLSEPPPPASQAEVDMLSARVDQLTEAVRQMLVAQQASASEPPA